jgi:hypothetical protein
MFFEHFRLERLDANDYRLCRTFHVSNIFRLTRDAGDNYRPIVIEHGEVSCCANCNLAQGSKGGETLYMYSGLRLIPTVGRYVRI